MLLPLCPGVLLQEPGVPVGAFAPCVHPQVCAVVSTGVHHTTWWVGSCRSRSLPAGTIVSNKQGLIAIDGPRFAAEGSSPLL
jgi:hypothetical protein